MSHPVLAETLSHDPFVAAHPPRGTGTGIDLRLAQLLCSRVCHDLIGAAGAIENGVDLLDEHPDDAADVRDLLGLSGRQLNRRLAFYRIAFGMSGGEDDTASLAEARRLAGGLLDGGRVALRWLGEGCGDRQSAASIRLVLCAVLIAAEGMVRGGTCRVTTASGSDGVVFAIEATGRGANVSEGVLAALDPEAPLETITARTVHAYYMARLARRVAARLEVRHAADGFALRLTIPGA